jgi:protein SCO1/2
MRNSALDNPRLLASFIGRLLDGPPPEGPARTYAQARELSMSRGEYLFTTRCAACHTIGRGDGVGPDLLGVVTARDRSWLERFIRFPDRMLAEGDPIASALYAKYNRVQMPNLLLGPEDAAAILGYLGAQTRPRAAGPPAGRSPSLSVSSAKEDR